MTDKEHKERRERIATAALVVLAGNINDPNATFGFDLDGMTTITLAQRAAKDAIVYADTLIAELDKEPSR